MLFYTVIAEKKKLVATPKQRHIELNKSVVKPTKKLLNLHLFFLSRAKTLLRKNFPTKM